MGSADVRDIRNFAICGHAKSGKTSLADTILYLTGVNSRIGKVDEKSSLSDYNADEIERKISINSSIFNFDYKGKRCYMVDVPGYLDFAGETISVLNVVDAAVVVIDALEGIGIGTDKAWQILDSRNLPRIIFISKIDKENTKLEETVESIRKEFGAKCQLLKFPLTQEKELIELIAETDDALLEKYLENGSLTEEELRGSLRAAVITNKLIPIISGSSQDADGVKKLLETIIECLPSPQDLPAWKCFDLETGEDVLLETKPSEPFLGYVFKTVSDPYVGQLSIFKVLSGSLSSNTGFFNVTKKAKEHIGDILLLQGKEQKQASSLVVGEVGAVAKLKDTQTQDTICDEKRKVVCKKIEFPQPVFSASVKPKTKKDEEKISDALAKLINEDPCFKVGWDQQTRESIISGMGDLHLEIMVGRLKKRFGVDVELGTPKVAYKETVRGTSEVQGKYKRQSGGRGQYGDVWIKVEPLEKGTGFQFEQKVVGGAIPRNYFPSIEKGIKQAMSEGILAGYPITDIKVTLYDGSYHQVDSSDMAFQIAGSMALKKGVQEANLVLLEPIVDAEVVVPEENMGEIAGNLSSHRGRVTGMEVRGKMQVIKALVPQAEMLKYANDLKSITAGRGGYTMSFSHYEEVPQKIASTIIAQAQKSKEATT